MNKEKFNKKKLLTFGVLGLLAIPLVIAATYYAVVIITLSITQPIDVDGDGPQVISCMAGESCLGDPITVTNDGNEEREIVLTESIEYPCHYNIDTNYIGELELTEKTVDFTKDVWEIPTDANTVTVEYTAIGSNFSAEVIDGAKEGYVLIYYKDNSDRFNSPANATLVENVIGNLPYQDDANADEYDYCETGEYDTCHGAKLWYVPKTAIMVDSLDWSKASEFYYETKLIQYISYNYDGIIVYPGSSFVFKPQFELDKYTSEGTCEANIYVR